VAIHEGLPWAGWVVAVGALFGLSTSLLGAMFPLPRVLYAMASDGVIPRFLSRVSSTFQTPLVATLLSGLLAAFMALLFNLSQLVDMMSIGTLLAYTMVGVCVLLLRYTDTSTMAATCNYTPLSTGDDLNDSEEELFPCSTPPNILVYTRREYLRQCFNLDGCTEPTPLSALVARHSTLMFSVLCLPLSIIVIHGNTSTFHTLSIGFTGFKMVTSVIILSRQPPDTAHIPFKVPLVPWLPACSILVNIFLMMKLSWQTWVRFAIWLLAGILVYGCYGWSNSSEEYRMKGQIPPNELKDDLTLEKFDKNKNKTNSRIDLDDYN